jgi:tripartite-type tricarboxylate transporter receptor subunit TctC
VHDTVPSKRAGIGSWTQTGIYGSSAPFDGRFLTKFAAIAVVLKSAAFVESGGVLMHRFRVRAAVCATLLIACLLGTISTRAEDYPAQRITIVVGFAAGGPVDVIARIVAESLQKRWNQPVVVENRAGAAGNLAAALVSKANPDGYTLLFTATGVVINQSLYDSPGYSIKDLLPLSFPATNSLLFAVHPSNPAHTFQDFVRDHRSASFTFGTAGVGSGAHITAEYVFRVLTKIEAIHTPYQGSPQAVSALLGNHIDLVTVPFPDAVKHVQQGSLRALAISGATRAEALPEVPTFLEAGIPNFSSYGWIAMFAPARVDPAIASKLNAAVNDILEQPDVKARLDSLGFVPNRQSLAETAARLELELANFAQMVAAIGLKMR